MNGPSYAESGAEQSPTQLRTFRHKATERLLPSDRIERQSERNAAAPVCGLDATVECDDVGTSRFDLLSRQLNAKRRRAAVGLYLL